MNMERSTVEPWLPPQLIGRKPDVVGDALQVPLEDRWIFTRLNHVVEEVNAAIASYRYHEVAQTLWHFFWHEFCDWYLEIKKMALEPNTGINGHWRNLLSVYEVALRLLHPVMPFITEALWRRFPGRPETGSISIAPWPRADARAVDAAAVRDFGLVQELVGAIRTIRAEYGIAPGQTVRAVAGVESPAAATALEDERATIIRLAKLSEFSLGESRERVGGHAVLSDGTAVFVPLGDAIDLGRECGRLGSEVDRLARLVESQEKKLGNEQFIARAPSEVVDRERQKLTTWRDQREVLERKRELLGCS
jgi:valyl-tRNA synthetase